MVSLETNHLSKQKTVCTEAGLSLWPDPNRSSLEAKEKRGSLLRQQSFCLQ